MTHLRTLCPTAPAAALATGLLFSALPAHTQSCSPALTAFQAAMKAGTSEVLAAYIDQHAPCFEAPAQAHLTALGGAPAPAAPETGAARYDGPQINLTAVGSPAYMGELVQEAEARLWTDAVPSVGNVTVEVQPDYGGYGSFNYAQLIADGTVDVGPLTSETATQLEGGFGTALAGLDVLLVAEDAGTLRAVHVAVRDSAARNASDAGLVLLGAAPVLPRYLVCLRPQARLHDLRNKDVRAFGPAADIVDALGGTGQPLPAWEVASYLKKLILDCALLADTQVYQHEVHRLGLHLIPAPILGWG